MTDEYEYKDPNTDIMKALSKAVDAATGETGTQYEYKNPNTDVIQKLEELTEAISTSGGGGSGHNYSTTEQVVGTWIDGSTIYEQSFAITNQTISTGWTVLVSSISIAKLISGEVCVGGGGYDYTWNALYYNNGNIAVYNFLGGAIQSANGYVTIRYTKNKHIS